MATAEGTAGGRATEVGREGRELAGNAVTAPLTAASQPRTWRPRHLPALPAPSLGTWARGERFQSRHGPRIGGDPQSSGLISLINSQLITWPSEEDVGSVGPRRGLAELGGGASGTPSLPGLPQLCEEEVQLLRHGHLVREGTPSVLRDAAGARGLHQGRRFGTGPGSIAPGKRRTYRVGLRLAEPAVSGAEPAEGRLRVAPHLRQAGQDLAHL